jgi:hypothetical protein
MGVSQYIPGAAQGKASVAEIVERTTSDDEGRMVLKVSESFQRR